MAQFSNTRPLGGLTAGICLALVGFATSLSAETPPFCAELDRLMTATRAAPPGPDALSVSFPGALQDTAACTVSLALSGGKTAHCRLTYDYRSASALAAFEAVQTLISACADPALGSATDLPVNHPDTYQLRLWQIASGEVGVSLKDKAALGQTFLFLRVTPAQ